MNRQRWLMVAGAVSVLLVGAAGTGYWIGQRQVATEAGSEQAAERRPLFYRHPMNPEITSDVPAKDSMGMDYVPVYGDEATAEVPGTVRIDPVMTQNIGVRTASAERRDLTRPVHALGRVEYDEQRIVRLHPKTEGWIEELFVDTTGQVIREDEILLDLYSPQLVATQQEYLLALNNLEALAESPFEDVRTGARQLAETALERLRLLDVPEHQIEDLRRTGTVKKRMHVHAPAGGVVVAVGAREGEHVTPATELYMIADLSRVWVMVDVYEEELPWVQVGDRAEIRVAAAPGEVLHGRISYINPYADDKTRTVKARLEVPNDSGRLRPDMFAEVTIHADPRRDALAVPSEAIVRSGLREQVFVVREPGKFEPREVRLGVAGQGWTEVLSGVEAGEEVVVSAQFLIDSESKLREAAAKMQETRSDHPNH